MTSDMVGLFMLVLVSIALSVTAITFWANAPDHSDVHSYVDLIIPADYTASKSLMSDETQNELYLLPGMTVAQAEGGTLSFFTVSSNLQLVPDTKTKYTPSVHAKLGRSLLKSVIRSTGETLQTRELSKANSGYVTDSFFECSYIDVNGTNLGPSFHMDDVYATVGEYYDAGGKLTSAYFRFHTFLSIPDAAVKISINSFLLNFYRAKFISCYNIGSGHYVYSDCQTLVSTNDAYTVDVFLTENRTNFSFTLHFFESVVCAVPCDNERF